MKIIADANILVRPIADDDEVQSPIARAHLDGSQLVALTLPTLCELPWILLRAYKVSRKDFADMLRILIAADNVKVDQSAFESGLAFLEAGGDFADGVIAHEGLWLGGETFVSFDAKAVSVAQGRGRKALTPQ